MGQADGQGWASWAVHPPNTTFPSAGSRHLLPCNLSEPLIKKERGLWVRLQWMHTWTRQVLCSQKHAHGCQGLLHTVVFVNYNSPRSTKITTTASDNSSHQTWTQAPTIGVLEHQETPKNQTGQAATLILPSMCPKRLTLCETPLIITRGDSLFAKATISGPIRMCTLLHNKRVQYIEEKTLSSRRFSYLKTWQESTYSLLN